MSRENEMAVMTKLTRTQVAKEIMRDAFVFVRRARAEGHVNTITEMLFWETAQARGFRERDFSIRTVKRLARENARIMDETELIDF